MAGNPACERYIPLLSPYVDGELSPGDRTHVERHLSACRDCTGRAADLRAESALLRVGLELAADEVDFRDFSQKVMARVTPERPPLLERLKLGLSETFLYQRTALVSSLATAAVLALVGLPFLLRERAPEGYGGERMTVQRVRTDEGARVAPVVMEADEGSAIIWLVDREPAAGDESRSDELELEPAQKPAAPAKKKAPQGGEL